MKIREARMEQGLSQNQLAAKAGMHPSTISAIESKHQVPYESQLEKLAEALDWPGEPDELIDDDDG